MSVLAQRDTTFYSPGSTEKWVGKLDAKGRKTGRWVRYNANDVKIEEGSFKILRRNGKTYECKQGFWVMYYPSGQKECEGNYAVQKFWRINRLSAWERERNFGEKGFLGFHRRRRRAYRPVRDGAWRYYNEDGTLTKEILYKKGKEVSGDK